MILIIQIGIIKIAILVHNTIKYIPETTEIRTREKAVQGSCMAFSEGSINN